MTGKIHLCSLCMTFCGAFWGMHFFVRVERMRSFHSLIVRVQWESEYKLMGPGWALSNGACYHYDSMSLHCVSLLSRTLCRVCSLLFWDLCCLEPTCARPSTPSSSWTLTLHHTMGLSHQNSLLPLPQVTPGLGKYTHWCFFEQGFTPLDQGQYTLLG